MQQAKKKMDCVTGWLFSEAVHLFYLPSRPPLINFFLRIQVPVHKILSSEDSLSAYGHSIGTSRFTGQMYDVTGGD